MKHLAALRGVAPRPRYYNLYGPTETNVCTFFEADDSTIREEGRPLPIGRVCFGDDALVLDPDGRVVSAGRGEGELLIAGGSVMLGYWNLPEQKAQAFHVDAAGQRWTRRGDNVREEEPAPCTIRGRRGGVV